MLTEYIIWKRPDSEVVRICYAVANVAAFTSAPEIEKYI